MDAHSNDSEEVRRLFGEQIPEVASGVIKIKSIARERGQRTVVAVHSSDSAVDPVGACVGLRGIRIKTIVKQLGQEMTDVVRWSESTEEFIRNALAPAKVDRIIIDAAANRATLYASPENKSLITRRQALCSRLVGLEIQVVDS